MCSARMLHQEALPGSGDDENIGKLRILQVTLFKWKIADCMNPKPSESLHGSE